jgi:hypothetical protein
MTASPAQILAAFDAAATERSINQPSKAYGAGACTWDLPHAGIPTYMVLTFNGTLTRTDGATGGTCAASPYWPFNVLGPSSLVDYAGITRIFADGWDLELMEIVKNFGAFPDDPYGSLAYAPDIFTAAIPAAKSGGGTASAPVIFGLIIPVSYMKASALGSYAATVPDGTAQYQLHENVLTGPTIASPLTIDGVNCTAASLSGTWNLTYYFLDAPNTVQIPLQALAQVHELYRQQSTENLAAGANNISDLLTGRTYYRVLQNIVEGNAPSIFHVANIQFLIDSSTPALDEYLAAYLVRIRNEYGRDMPAGVILRDFTAKPWTPDSYGSLTARNILNGSFNAGSYANVVTLRECLYVPAGNLVQMGAGA